MEKNKRNNAAVIIDFIRMHDFMLIIDTYDAVFIWRWRLLMDLFIR